MPYQYDESNSAARGTLTANARHQTEEVSMRKLKASQQIAAAQWPHRIIAAVNGGRTAGQKG